jgi:hypothetical protein
MVKCDKLATIQHNRNKDVEWATTVGWGKGKSIFGELPKGHERPGMRGAGRREQQQHYHHDQECWHFLKQKSLGIGG